MLLIVAAFSSFLESVVPFINPKKDVFNVFRRSQSRILMFTVSNIVLQQTRY